MEITKQLLDVRICDHVPKTNNEETYREFIRNSEDEFELLPCDLDNMDDETLNLYLDFLDDLWNK
jgi:hypothetical protein